MVQKGNQDCKNLGTYDSWVSSFNHCLKITQDKSGAETAEDIPDTTYAAISLSNHNYSGENQEVVQEGDRRVNK